MTDKLNHIKIIISPDMYEAEITSSELDFKQTKKEFKSILKTVFGVYVEMNKDDINIH